MLRKLMTGAAALVLGGSLAAAGDFGVRVEAGVEVGQQASKLIDKNLDYSTLVYQPYVQVSRFGNGPCFSLRARGLFSVDEDTEVADIKAETKTSGYNVQALAGFGWAIPPGLKLAPVAGVSFHNLTTQTELKDVDGKVDYDYNTLILEVGAHAEVALGPLIVTAQLTGGPVITGDTKLSARNILGDTSDSASVGFADGYHLEARVGVDFKFTDLVGLHAGLNYERFASKTEEFKDLGETSSDALDRVTVHFGLSVLF